MDPYDMDPERKFEAAALGNKTFREFEQSFKHIKDVEFKNDIMLLVLCHVLVTFRHLRIPLEEHEQFNNLVFKIIKKSEF